MISVKLFYAIGITPQEATAAPLSSMRAPTASAASVPTGKAYLGLRGQTFHQGSVQGVKILEVFPASPTARAGLPSGRHGARNLRYVIVEVDGHPVRSEEDLGQVLSQNVPGAQMQLRLTDSAGKTSKVLSVTLGTAPETFPDASHATAVTALRLSASSQPPDTLPTPAEPALPAPDGAGSAQALPWPGKDTERVESMPQPEDGVWRGATPVGWSERLLGVPLKAVGRAPAETVAGGLDTPTDLIDTYIDKLDVMPVQRTRLVKIAFSTPDPELAARVANAHAKAYLRQGLELRSRANGEALLFLEEKLTELKQRMEKSEANLNRYRRERGIISLDNRENIVVDRLADLNKRLTEAEAERIGLEAQVRLIRKNDYEAIPAVLDNRLVQTMKGDLARLEGEQADLATKFKPGYPELDQLRAKVEQTRRRLQQEIQRTVGGIKSAYATAKQKEDELRIRMEQQKTAALGLKDASVEYAILAREVDTNRQLYESVLQRMKEMQVAAALRASNVSVIDQAVSPLRPSRPNKKLSLVLGAMVGLVGGIGLAFFVEHLSNTLKTPLDAERYLHLPSLGAVPDFRRIARRRTPAHTTPAGDLQLLDAAAIHPSFILAHEPLSVITEAYRTLRTALLLASADNAPKTMLFTSGVHGEGKTVTTLNTAAVLAQMGVRVLVIDADLRCASCHTVLGLSNDAGLTEVLTAQREPEEVIQATTIEHLFFLSSGSLPPNPTELVASPAMRETLSALQQHYDYILIDSPPIMPANEAVLLSTLVDGVVLIANAQQTPKQITREALARLQYARAKILGVVLNRLPLRSKAYAYYYRQYKSEF